MTRAEFKVLAPHTGKPVLFLDIDGVLNYVKHSPQIHLEKELVSRLKRILEETDALIVLSTFWRHFHEYISYVLHRDGIDVARCMLEMPMGSTPGKQSTKTFLKFHRKRLQENQVVGSRKGVAEVVEQRSNSGGMDENAEDSNNIVIGRSSEDEGEYLCRADEIEAWLRIYGERYLGAYDNETGGKNCVKSIGNDGCSFCDFIHHDKMSGFSKSSESGDDIISTTATDFNFHPEFWKYVIIDDRPTAAKPGTPLFERLVLTHTKLGLTDENVQYAIRLLLHGPEKEETDRNGAG